MPYVNLIKFTYVMILMRIIDKPLFQDLLGSEMKQRILLFLAANQAPLTERELARLLGKSHTAVNKTLKELGDLDAVECRTIGRANVWTMNEKSLAFEVLSGSHPGSGSPRCVLSRRSCRRPSKT